VLHDGRKFLCCEIFTRNLISGYVLDSVQIGWNEGRICCQHSTLSGLKYQTIERKMLSGLFYIIFFDATILKFDRKSFPVFKMIQDICFSTEKNGRQDFVTCCKCLVK